MALDHPRGQMHLRPRHRLRIALVAIFCLLFQQLAVAAYACEPPASAAQASMPPDCEQMQMPGEAQDSSPLCGKHCTPDQATTADHVQLSVPAVAMGPVVFASLLASKDAGDALRAHVPVSCSDPPPRLRYCSLLI